MSQSWQLHVKVEVGNSGSKYDSKNEFFGQKNIMLILYRIIWIYQTKVKFEISTSTSIFKLYSIFYTQLAGLSE